MSFKRIAKTVMKSLVHSHGCRKLVGKHSNDCVRIKNCLDTHEIVPLLELSTPCSATAKIWALFCSSIASPSKVANLTIWKVCRTKLKVFICFPRFSIKIMRALSQWRQIKYNFRQVANQNWRNHQSLFNNSFLSLQLQRSQQHLFSLN